MEKQVRESSLAGDWLAFGRAAGGFAVEAGRELRGAAYDAGKWAVSGAVEQVHGAAYAAFSWAGDKLNHVPESLYTEIRAERPLHDADLLARSRLTGEPDVAMGALERLTDDYIEVAKDPDIPVAEERLIARQVEEIAGVPLPSGSDALTLAPDAPVTAYPDVAIPAVGVYEPDASTDRPER